MAHAPVVDGQVPARPYPCTPYAVLRKHECTLPRAVPQYASSVLRIAPSTIVCSASTARVRTWH
eukprot:2733867-Rhodomonas_salina.1